MINTTNILNFSIPNEFYYHYQWLNNYLPRCSLIKKSHKLFKKIGNIF